jgi:hypothetical protein
MNNPRVQTVMVLILVLIAPCSAQLPGSIQVSAGLAARRHYSSNTLQLAPGPILDLGLPLPWSLLLSAQFRCGAMAGEYKLVGVEIEREFRFGFWRPCLDSLSVTSTFFA